MKPIRPILRLIERAILKWAQRELCPSHPVVPKIVRRLADDRAESPMDPADSLVTGACILAALVFFGLVALGVVN